VGKVNPSVRGGGSTISSVQIGKALLSPLPQEEERKEASELLRGQSPYLFSASHRV